ncbi:hypothetical protein HDU93_007141 [Gonapodya sp. JEL0774]|nr:hypothetical protein HDU93_007141 [Gonapodya sp. JEL0774]
MTLLKLASVAGIAAAVLVLSAYTAPLPHANGPRFHPRAPVAAAADSLDGVCATLQLFSGDSSVGYLYRNGNGYAFTSAVASATSFRLEATLLNRYEIFDSSGGHLFLSVITWIMPGADYGDRSDWTFKLNVNGRYTITSTNYGSQIGVYLGTLGGSSSGYTMALATATGCFTPPDVATFTSGRPQVGVTSSGKLLGVMDMHAHIAAANAFGGDMHCGDAWASGGVTAAMPTHNCPEFLTSIGIGTLLEGLFAGTALSAVEDGWPTFNDWPSWNSVLHEQSYYRSIQRAYESGLRVLNALLVANRVICELFPVKSLGSCDEMDQIRAQVTYLYKMQDYIDAESGGAGKGWFRIAKTPSEVRSIVAAGNLAVIIGMEMSEVFGCRIVKGVSQCSKADIDAGFDEVAAMGVTGFFPVHKFNNALGGTRMDPGTTGAFINIGNAWSTGEWWDLESCPTGPNDQPSAVTSADFGLVLALNLLGLPSGKSLPNYPSGPVCNKQGLTALGEYVIRKMMSRGWIVHVDHMSIPTSNATMNIILSSGYPGVISEHSWSDYSTVNKVLQAGGVVAAYPYNATKFVQEWRNYRNLQYGSKITSFGVGTDVNGLAVQATPRTDASIDPFVYYPFTSLAGTTVQKQVVGQRTYDINTDGVAQYGQYAEWFVDNLHKAGSEGDMLKQQFLNSAETYVAMWEKSRKWAGLD